MGPAPHTPIVGAAPAASLMGTQPAPHTGAQPAPYSTEALIASGAYFAETLWVHHYNTNPPTHSHPAAPNHRFIQNRWYRVYGGNNPYCVQALVKLVVANS
jgi:hypothetical protein